MRSPHPLLEVQDRLQKKLLAINQGSVNGNRSLDLTPLFPETESLVVLLMQIDELKKCLDSFRPLTPAEAQNLSDAFDLEYTFESNRIEGNSLTLAETQVVLEHGVTVAGKPLIHHLEAINHRDALLFVKKLVGKNVLLTPSILLDINRMIFTNYVVVPDQMEMLFANFQLWPAEKRHPVEIAADLHFQLVRIHPFVDGNGRSARLMMSFWLLQNGYTIANLSGENTQRIRYYNALEAASVEGNIEPFKHLIYEREKASLLWHLEGLTPDIENGRGDYFLKTIGTLL